MSKYVLVISGLIGFVLLTACSPNKSYPNENVISPALDSLSHLPALAGNYFPLASKETGRTYHIYVRLPEGYDAAEPDTLYPIVYLTDGDSLFPMLAPVHLFMSYDDKIPDAIIVGIAYGSFDPAINKRDVDYAEGIGADAYQWFMANELLPLIEGKYRGNPERRILFGQSHGGNFVLHSAYTQPDLFWGRIGSNPSFRSEFNPEINPPGKASRKDLQLIIASGERDYDVLREKALAWKTQIEAADNLPWEVNFISITEGTHAASAPQVYRMGMRELFNWNQGESERE